LSTLLKVDSLTIHYTTRRGTVRAVDNVSFSMKKGETFGVVGESGSGKSTLGLSLMRLVPHPGRIVRGRIIIDGTDIMSLSEKKMRSIRGRKVAFVFQDPMTSLNPVKKIGAHFVEYLRTHEPKISEEKALKLVETTLKMMRPTKGRKVPFIFQDPMASLNLLKEIRADFVEYIRTREPKISEEEALKRAETILNELGILPERINDYPHQFSGGMRQRIMIGLAIALNPKLVIADEPTTALDVIVQAKILDILKNLCEAHEMALILITHDLSIVLERCDKVIVMYAGHLVEYADTTEIHKDPKHPYTQGLLQTIPNIELAEQKLEAIPGSPPDLLNPPKGCRFWPRCSYAMETCRLKVPPVIKVGTDHLVRCFLYGGTA